MAIRSKRELTWGEQQKAAEYLVTAAGFSSTSHGRAFPFNGTADAARRGAATAPDGLQLPGYGGSVNISHTAHRGAVRELAKAFLDGSGVSQDMRLALELFRNAAEAGDAEAQGHMGLCYSMGLDSPDCWTADGIVRFGPPKPAEALLHYYFGAAGGDMTSRMAMGYRHLTGLGVPRSCWSAASYYQPVGEKVSDLAAATMPPPTTLEDDEPADDSSSGASGGTSSSAADDSIAPELAPPSGSLPHVERIRLHLQAAQGGLRSERHREVVQYYQYSADRGNTEAQTAVGQVLNYGTHGVDRDHGAALAYFKLAAAAGDVDAMAHLGAMFANGYGTRRSYEQAVDWWTRAARRNNANALFGLGYLYLTARGVSQDYDRAFQYFSKAAEQVHAEARPDALFYMGVMHLKGYGVRRKSVQRALSYFTLAAHAGHSLAQYNAAMMHLAGKGTPRNCKPAVSLLKALSERGPAASSVQQGHEHFFRGRYGLALLSYLRAADLGMEVAQSNAAWMLERGYAPGLGASELAFSLYKQSAAQSNVHSLLCMGDSYFYGRGVEQDWVRSAALYYEAYQERSAEAMFNLGFMHEFGVGVPQDLQLAKRFYNMAKHTQADAFLPVALANAWLQLHAWWDKLRPLLPSTPFLDPIWNSVFALHPPHTSLFGPWVARAQRLLPNLALFQAEVAFWRWMDVAGLGALGGVLQLGDAGESVMLLALLGGLALVVRLRRRRAEARQQQQDAARLLLAAEAQAQAMVAAVMAGGLGVEPGRPVPTAAGAPAAARGQQPPAGEVAAGEVAAQAVGSTAAGAAGTAYGAAAAEPAQDGSGAAGAAH
ncbi:hypothetical protein CHLRE_03g197400v5 [Chlamydomonas reinhardtii]|uniref:Uncharacterized protein n=1 Tax=Chlamydomonas reinhardtii TaxID=3055 RepID=A0A2K3DYS1_CHLRE|nr:uncharacterized protein CHLRE_03g197400v5 [Chlamydomonas reinhardtii]PNW85669.1 hypothetical protein CHLRE_03g197400v5 [Chlamydomonas reinhardtii]